MRYAGRGGFFIVQPRHRCHSLIFCPLILACAARDKLLIFNISSFITGKLGYRLRLGVSTCSNLMQLQSVQLI